jgi:hypothetical protein
MQAFRRIKSYSAALVVLGAVAGCGSATHDSGTDSGGAGAAAIDTSNGGSAGARAVTAGGGSASNAGSTGTDPSWNSGDTALECAGIPVSESEDAGAAGQGSSACAGVSLEAEAVPVDLFIMMDRSVSMNELVPGTNQTRWAALRAAVEQFVEDAAGSNIRAGIGFFGRSGARDDELDCDASAYANPTVEIGDLASVGSQLTAAIDATPPGGLTPTLPALQGALHHAQQWAMGHPGRATSVVLVTDGFPTQCQSPVSIADIAGVASAARNAAPFVRTFVIGLAAGFNLDSIAAAGGTSHAYLVDEGDVSASFAHTLSNISDSRIVCDYDIPPAPNSNVALDYDHVQLLYSPASGATEQVPRLTSSAACGRNPNGGWYYDDESHPTRISVCPCTCARFAAGRVDVRLGCEPYIGLR